MSYQGFDDAGNVLDVTAGAVTIVGVGLSCPAQFSLPTDPGEVEELVRAILTTTGCQLKDTWPDCAGVIDDNDWEVVKRDE